MGMTRPQDPDFVFRGTLEPIQSLRVSTCKRYLFTGTRDGTLHIWDWLASKRRLSSVSLHSSFCIVSIQALTSDASHLHLITQARHDRICSWRISNPGWQVEACLWEFRNGHIGFCAVALVPDLLGSQRETKLLVPTVQEIAMLDTTDGSILSKWPLPFEGKVPFHLASTADRFAVAFEDGSIFIVSLDTWQTLHHFQDIHRDCILGMDITNGTKGYSVSADRHLTCWSLESFAVDWRTEFKSKSGPTTLKVRNDGRILAIVKSNSKGLALYRCKEGRYLGTLHVEAPLTCVLFETVPEMFPDPKKDPERQRTFLQNDCNRQLTRNALIVGAEDGRVFMWFIY